MSLTSQPKRLRAAAIVLLPLFCLGLLAEAALAGMAAPLAAPPAAAPTATPGARFYNLPTTVLKTPSRLYASPNSLQAIARVDIPKGQKLYIMGINKTKSHLRVVWNTGVGWVPVSFTDMNGRMKELRQIPTFEHEPPACAQYVVTQNSLKSRWKSGKKQEIVVVVDLFRSRYGAFPKSYLSLKLDGKRIDSSRREIIERGQFSLKDVVFKLPDQIQAGQILGYELETASDEPLTFVATLFRVPPDCTWKVD